MTTIGIIGSGNVAWHLAHGFLQSPDFEIAWITGRNETTLSELSGTTGIKTHTKYPGKAVDLVLVCVNDDAIQEVLNQLPSSCNVAYTSGSVSMNQLLFQQQNLGVFYPLQTFTRHRKVDLADVPFLIEANHEPFAKELESIARKLSNNVQRMDSGQRKQLHIAAVFSNNFVNHLLLLAQEHLKDKKIDKAILNPLITETIHKALDLGPFDAQSGPARRSDKQTIETHLNELEGIQKEIYRLLSESIEKTYSK